MTELTSVSNTVSRSHAWLLRHCLILMSHIYFVPTHKSQNKLPRFHTAGAGPLQTDGKAGGGFGEEDGGTWNEHCFKWSNLCRKLLFSHPLFAFWRGDTGFANGQERLVSLTLQEQTKNDFLCLDFFLFHLAGWSVHFVVVSYLIHSFPSFLCFFTLLDRGQTRSTYLPTTRKDIVLLTKKGKN